MNREKRRTNFRPMILAAVLYPLAATAATITFEEPIPQPQDVQMQYASVPAYNVGVVFLGGAKIFTPTVATSSPTKALYNDLGTEFDETKGLGIRFTAPQTEYVSMKVGLDRAYSFDVSAYLTAYSGDEPGAPGTQIVRSVVPLGKGPAPITTLITATAATAKIRSVRLEFLGPAQGQFAVEVIDDLTFDTAGPGTASDTTPPAVAITEPSSDGLQTYVPQIALAYTATDKETGIAAIQVAFLDKGGKEVGSFDSCGGSGGPPCAHDASPLSSSGSFLTFLADGTASIRVKAWDYAGHTGQAVRSVNYTPPPPTTNVWALGMEITQATQPWVATSMASRSETEPYISVDPSSVPFIAGRRTVVRVYPGIEGSGGIALAGSLARLRCMYTASGIPCPGPWEIEPSSTIAIDPANANAIATLRANASRTWNFVLPDAWTTTKEKVSLRATVSPPPMVAECFDCKDAANSIRVQGIEFQRTATLDLRLVWGRVRRRADDPVGVGQTAPSTIHQDVFQDSGSLFLKTYPIAPADIRLTIHSPQYIDFDGQFLPPFDAPGPDQGALTSDRMGAFLGLMAEIAKQLNPAPPINSIVFGMVPPRVTDTAGIGIPNAAIACLIRAQPRDGQLTAEEIGHSLGRDHASCNHGEAGGGKCDAAPAVFPCLHGGICTFGFDTTAMQVIDPGDTTGVGGHMHDFMSYGAMENWPSPHWVSPHTYTKIFDALHGALPPGKGDPDPRPKADGEAFWLRGTVREKPVITGALFPAYHLLQSDVPVDAGRGAYRIELRDAAGRVLFARSFDVDLVVGDPPDPAYPPTGHFIEKVPYFANTARIVLIRDRAILSELARSPNPPVARIVLPRGGDVWDEAGAYEVVWQTDDPDLNGPLDASLWQTVQYSRDDGASWSLVASDTRESSLVLDGAHLGGAQRARIRVLATDGIDTAIAISEPFAVKGKPPSAWIVSPSAGERSIASFQEHDLVILEGGGTDLEDGPLGDAAFSWHSDRDGPLGTGHRVDTRMLTPGIHEITLEARDGDGEIGTAVVPVEIVEGRNAQPIADAGPDSMAIPAIPLRLDGTGSIDLDGDPLSFLWTIVTRPAGSRPLLSDPRAATPDFEASAEGTYVLVLVVHDGEVASLPDAVTIEVAQSPYRLRFGSASGCRGGQVRTNVLLTNPEPVQAFSIGMGFDAAAASLAALTLADTVASGAEYFQPHIDARAGWGTAGVILATGGAPRSIPAGTDQPILGCIFSIPCGAGERAALRFEDGHRPNILAVKNELTVDGTEVIPRRDDAGISIGDPPAPAVTAACQGNQVLICWDRGACSGPASRVQILRDGSTIADLAPDPGCHVDRPCGGAPQERTFSYEVRLTSACGRTLSGTTRVTCCGGGAVFMRGDSDGDGMYTLGDGVQILMRQFVGLPRLGSNCDDAGDIDDNGMFTIGDAIWLFNYLFAEGRPPVPPYGRCGADPTPATTLGCAGYPVENCP